MATACYLALAAMLTAYVVLDGFDLGCGILHRVLPRSDEERRAVYAAIGPYWDGNEVWLLAAGGLTFAAFPSVLGSALSGMYLAIFLFVWLLLGRGLSIELRGHLLDPLWRAFWDAVFTLSSAGLALLLGVAGGNVVRGFVLDESGDFQLALFDELTLASHTGLIDLFTLSAGVYTVTTMTLHGACFLAWKQPQALGERAQRLGRSWAGVVAVVWLGLLSMTWAVRPELLARGATRPLVWLGVLLAVAGLILAWRARERLAFIGSSLHIAGVLMATAAAAYPTLLHGYTGTSLTVGNSAAPVSSLSAIARWYPFGLALATLYGAALFFIHRGKVRLDPESAADHDHVTTGPADQRPG